MMTLSSFVLVGTIVSYDSFLATVEFQLNPATNGGPSLAVMPVSAIPCDLKIGQKLYVVKNETEEIPSITCESKANRVTH